MISAYKKWRNKDSVNRKFLNFKANKRGYYSFYIFLVLFVLTTFAEFIANDKPLILYFKGEIYFPIISQITEEEMGGDYVTDPDFNDLFVQNLVKEHGWAIMPPIHFNYQTINFNLPSPAPSPPDSINWLGTDDQGRDVLARLIYGFRISVFFGLILTIFSSIIGIAMGAIQGYSGGKTDLFLQRFIEIWSGLPTLYILIILSSIVIPSFWWLLFIMLLFSWLSLVSVVRAEFLKARNLGYVRAAHALGVSELGIIFKHILPNAFVASMTYIPFLLNGAITTLTSLDFLGLGLPPGSASLGEMLGQAKNNLHAPWLAISVFLTLTMLLTLLIFIGEAIRDAFDPRK
jgi:microcin C transport system permease protein